MDANDVLDAMAEVQNDCARRGCTDANAVMRAMSEVRRKMTGGMSAKQAVAEVNEALRLLGFTLEGEGSGATLNPIEQQTGMTLTRADQLKGAR